MGKTVETGSKWSLQCRNTIAGGRWEGWRCDLFRWHFGSHMFQDALAWDDESTDRTGG